MLQQLQVYTVLTNDAQMRRTLVLLRIIVYFVCSDANEAAANLEKEAQKHILNLAQAVGTTAALKALSEAEIVEETQDAHSNSAKYKKIKLKSGKEGVAQKFCPLVEVVAKTSIDCAENALHKWAADIKKLKQVPTIDSANAETAMCCVETAGGICEDGNSSHISIKSHRLYDKAAQDVAESRLSKNEPTKHT
ncbi:hypothetical protein DPX39_060077300 [Trypanosoma brucei equiperdum]|uniref:Uncharacterized protein n=1 Tax=Trypanosoma brucei equiperdum TaxID=630700 RepID=A0A3L6LCJ7_9TRYP|nr:hypothetical protein DPX39_060083400 [Trypanosoma brucei equiperdum]RHW71962.1 hypothetical protein DPX39_060065100 [Trypanosoma brucei equiperdum]RHW71977.1 hypothetical protein DPX39_060071200 [Trypanosoma brucei equiperdum]RHW72100.1 hypothetical protein DPX39_060077300 [Trypanosoma brucei equiperdum]